MSDIRTSFTYDPIRQGYDTNSWRTIAGAPSIVAGGRLAVDGGSGTGGAAVHYADFLKGDISFNINSGGPGADTGHLFGVVALNSSAYIRFSIGNTLTCQTGNNGVTSESSAIPWNSLWTGANVEFRIRWEAGGAKFFIAGSQVYAISDTSVPHGPLSLYLYDDSSASMTVGDMNVRGTQSFVMNPKTSDTSSYGGLLSVSQSVTVTDVINGMKIVTLMLPWNGGNLFEGVTITESSTIVTRVGTSINDAITLTEGLTVVRV